MPIASSKICTLCKVDKPGSDFFTRNNGKYLTSWCKNCSKLKSLSWKRKTNYKRKPQTKEERRKYNLKRLYNLTPDKYQEMLVSQSGKCAICGRSQNENFNSVLYVDHCHKTGHVRGLLCGPCNSGLGGFGDSEDTMRAAINYLGRVNLSR